VEIDFQSTTQQYFLSLTVSMGGDYFYLFGRR